MAITINQKPGGFEPAGKDLIFVVNSTNVGNFKFKFVFDVEINGTLIARVLSNSNPVSKGIFNCAEIVRSVMSADTQIIGSTVFIAKAPNLYQPGLLSGSQGNSIKKVKIQCGESYSSTATGDPVIYPNLASHDFFCWNGTFNQHNNFIDDSSEYYALPNASGSIYGRILSNLDWCRNEQNNTQQIGFDNESPLAPLPGGAFFLQKVYFGDYATMSFLNDNGTYLTGNYNTDVLYRVWKRDGTSFAVNIPLYPGGNVSPTQKLIHMGVGPSNISQVGGAGLIPSNWTPQSLGADLAWYSFQFNSGQGGGNNTEPYVFVWGEDNCGGKNKSESDGSLPYYRVMWLNDLGGWDYYNFGKFSQENVKVSRKSYTKIRGNYGSADGSGTPFTYQTDQRGKQDTQVYPEVNYTLSTGFLETWEFRFLSNIVKSSSVFFQLCGQAGILHPFIPCNVLDSNFAFQRTEVGKPKQAKIKIQESNTQYNSKG
tara:strand:- start:6836 stop:8284 length:1449 start_codon:yes stop_codon:yes gene_type:complete